MPKLNPRDYMRKPLNLKPSQHKRLVRIAKKDNLFYSEAFDLCLDAYEAQEAAKDTAKSMQTAFKQ